MDPKAIFRTRWPGAVLEALVKSNEILRPFDRDFSRAILLFWLQCREKVPFSFLVNWSPAGSILWRKCPDWFPCCSSLVGKVPRLIPCWSHVGGESAQIDPTLVKIWKARLYRLAGLAKARPALKIQIFQTSGPKNHFQDALTRSSFRSSRQVQWNPQTIW